MIWGVFPVIGKEKEKAAQRVPRLCRLMEQKGIDLMVVYSNALKPDNVSYVTGYNLLAGEAWASIDRDGEVSLWLSEEWDLERASATSWAGRIALTGSLAVPEWEKHRTVALAGLELVPHRHEEMMGHFLSQVRSGSALLDEAALVKTAGELDLVRRAAAIADAGFETACRIARPGIKEFELLAEMEYTMRLAGAIDNFQLVASGNKNLGMVVGRPKELAAGELVLFEITPTCNSVTYSAQLCRTIFLGQVEPWLEEKHAILVEAMQAALDTIRPGIPWSKVCQVQNEVIGEAGYQGYCGPPYMRTRGHGFGLTQSFNIDENNAVVMEPGMAFVVHPNQFLPETGYLALGEMVIVTEAGCERLSRIPMQLFAVS